MGDPAELTTAPADDQAPSWSRDGTRLAYWSVDPTGSSLIAMKTDGSESMTVFTDDAGRTPHTMDWSPDGSAMAFALCPDAMCGELFVAASDGTGTSSVGGSAFETYALAWSPDGKTIAFGGRYDGQPVGVYGMTPDGSDVRRIGGIEGGQDGFARVDWSADGTSIVTHAGTDALGPDIWVVAADGGGEANLTEGAARGFLPDLSPDDSRIAFRDGDTVFLVPTEGGDVRVIGSGEDYSWSPDAFLLVLETPEGVRMIDVRTGETVRRSPMSCPSTHGNGWRHRPGGPRSEHGAGSTPQRRGPAPTQASPNDAAIGSADQAAWRARRSSMTADDGFGRPLTSWLEEESVLRAPDDLLPAVLERAARTRRHPAWATPGRWISMETQAQLGLVPTTALLLAIVGLMIVLAAATFAAGSGGSGLDPTGPAGNGLFAYGSHGDI